MFKRSRFFFFRFRFCSVFGRRVPSPPARQRTVMCAAASATACPTMFSHYCCDTWPPRCDYSSYDQLLDVQLYRDNDGRIYCVYVSHTTLICVIRQYRCVYYAFALVQVSVAVRVLMRPKLFRRVFFRDHYGILLSLSRDISCRRFRTGELCCYRPKRYIPAVLRHPDS